MIVSQILLLILRQLVSVVPTAAFADLIFPHNIECHPRRCERSQPDHRQSNPEASLICGSLILQERVAPNDTAVHEIVSDALCEKWQRTDASESYLILPNPTCIAAPMPLL